MLGIELFINDIEAVVNKLKIKFAASVLYRKAKDLPSMEVVIQGNHSVKLKQILSSEFGLDDSSVAVEERIKAKKKNPKM